MNTVGLSPAAEIEHGAAAHVRRNAHPADPELDRLCEAGLVEIDAAGGWKLTRLGEAAMARFYEQVEGSPFWRA